jgi:hypothetical protein
MPGRGTSDPEPSRCTAAIWCRPEPRTPIESTCADATAARRRIHEADAVSDEDCVAPRGTRSSRPHFDEIQGGTRYPMPGMPRVCQTARGYQKAAPQWISGVHLANDLRPRRVPGQSRRWHDEIPTTARRIPEAMAPNQVQVSSWSGNSLPAGRSSHLSGKGRWKPLATHKLRHYLRDSIGRKE